METMISAGQALELIKMNVMPLDAVTVNLKEAGALALAADIISTISIPAFAQSGMDGYAFAWDENRTSYTLCGEVAAGSEQPFVVQPGTAVRIFTGAAVPEGADTVLMQEKATLESGQLVLPAEKIKKGEHVRPIGSEIICGSRALEKGTMLRPASIGFLAGIGVEEVTVYPKPTIGILVTGNELQKPGMPLRHGQVYESNSYALSAALQQLQMEQVKIVQAPDNLEQLTEQLTLLLKEADMVLVTGGVSVGDYDFTLSAMEGSGVTPIFHKVKQKPGKPLLFGKKDRQLVFGLPGNPASVLTCFYTYVLPAIGWLMGRDTALQQLQVPLLHDFRKPEGLTHFLKAFYDGTGATLQTGQESYKLSSFATANCLAVFPEQCGAVEAGSLIQIQMIP